MNITIVLLEAIIVGVVLVILGHIVGATTTSYFKVSLPEICKRWNEKYVFEYTLFMTGFLGHILCELTGINRLYCTSGHACGGQY